jgi:hypothetical protein
LADTVPIWVPVATAFGGFLSSGVLEWLKDERGNRRASQAHKAQREEARQDRRDDSQIESIKALQKAMYDNGLAVRDYNYERKHGEGSHEALEAFTRMEATQADTILYMVRLIDDEGRGLVEAFLKAANRASDAPSKESEDNMAKTLRSANNRLGELYRKLLQNP